MGAVALEGAGQEDGEIFDQRQAGELVCVHPDRFALGARLRLLQGLRTADTDVQPDARDPSGVEQDGAAQAQIAWREPRFLADLPPG